MAEWIALDRLALVPQPHRIVGIDADGRSVDHADFRTRVLGWQRAFAAAPGHDWALYFDDTLAFAAALFGAWHAGKRVFLGGDNLPATLDGLRPHVAGFAGDVPAHLAPLQPQRGADPHALLEALDEDALELVVFTSGSTGAPSAIGKRLRQLIREVDALQAAFGAQLEGAQVHGTVSHQHIYGLLFRVSRAGSSTKTWSVRWPASRRCWSPPRPTSSACPNSWTGRPWAAACAPCFPPAVRCPATRRCRHARCSA